MAGTMENKAVKEMPQGPHLSLLLIGKTGMGKSSTGNTILSESRDEFADTVFYATGESRSVTKGVTKETCTVRGRKITVVDTPGTCDTKEDPYITLKEIASAVEKSVDGYHAFLIIIRYPTRLTKEEHKAITQLTDLFGKEVFKYIIVVFTSGNTFYMEQKKAARRGEMIHTFEEFIYRDELSDDPGAMGPLLKKFKGGVVLFDNLEPDPDKRDNMVAELIEKVDAVRVQNNDKRYNNHIFQYAKKVVEDLKQKEKASEQQGEREKNESTAVKVLEITGKVADMVFKYILKNTACTIL